jgi:2'-5' RNA ligase
VLWAGLDDPDGRMAALAADLDETLAREFEREKRAFTAHLTVARFEPAVALDDLGTDLRSEAFTVDHVVLFRSHLQRPAPVYEALRRFPLRGRSLSPRPLATGEPAPVVDPEHTFD